jgi:hypothetical protein
VIRRIYRQTKDEVMGGRRKLHIEELYNLYSSLIIRTIKSRRMKWAGHVTRMGRKRNTYRILAGKPEGKGPHVIPSRRLENNIKMDLREIEWGDMDWIDLAQDRALVNTVINLGGFRKFLE